MSSASWFDADADLDVVEALAVMAARDAFHRRYPSSTPLTDSDSEEDEDRVEDEGAFAKATAWADADDDKENCAEGKVDYEGRAERMDDMKEAPIDQELSELDDVDELSALIDHDEDASESDDDEEEAYFDAAAEATDNVVREKLMRQRPKSASSRLGGPASGRPLSASRNAASSWPRTKKAVAKPKM